MNSFDHYLEDLLAANKGKRIVPFEYEGKKYWLKQVEQQKGAEKFLKPFPAKALEKEIKRLQWLNLQQVPTAELVRSGEGYFVSTDVGDAIDKLLKSNTLTDERKHQLIALAARKLAQIHHQDLIHGRPAIRDITCLDNKVFFIDFEAQSLFSNLNYQKRRDVIVFFYSMFQSKLDEKYVQTAMNEYAKENPENWKKSLTLLKSLSFIYYIALPFKPIARSDLISIIRLFEVVLDK